MNQLRVYILAAILTAVGLGLCAYKSLSLGLPLTPTKETEIWIVEARIAFEASGQAVKAAVTLPSDTPGFEILDEDFVSRDFGLALESDKDTRRALWSIRRARGEQVLYYRMTLKPTDRPKVHEGRQPPYPVKPDYPEPENSAIESLLSDVRSHSADISSFTRQLILRLSKDASNPAIDLLRDQAPTDLSWTRQLVEILAGARIPARVVMGVRLGESVQGGHLVPWLEVHNEESWLPFNPRTGDPGFPPNFLVWHFGDSPHPVSIEGAKLTDFQVSTRSGQQDLLSVARKASGDGASPIAAISLLGLPVHVQNVYAILLMVPLGAFFVAFLRNVIGIRTFGTFMPVLIALAFRETQLLSGILLFTGIVALGLALRFALEKLKLLLVPRLSAVLIIVILLMLGFSLAGYRLGFEQGLSVALFPMVILAMTIERMSIVWEEHGGRDAMLQGLGSLLVAALSYLVMSEDHLQHLVFIFPELLLVVLALTLLLGRYTGYRLTELWRFRSALKGEPS